MARILTSRAGAVLTVVNNDPATKNALSWEFYDGFRETIETAEADPETRAVVLTGAEGFFCSGGNVAGLKERSEAEYAVRRASVDKLHSLIKTMRASPLPIIAAIEGGAAGAGAPLALACDLIVSARDAYVSIAYVKIGLTPDGGSTAFLGPAIPRQLLTEMVWTGDRVPVERLHQLGLINRLVDPGAALGEAQDWAATLARGPAAALARGKALIEASGRASLSDQLDAEADGIAEALGGPEGREGIAAFLSKRRPDFSKLG